ncbi:NAD(P)/FAD-dependent oxidoreductase [Chitinimonas sp. PSY-7]|uniref:FAD-dependent oxidoreductase n=1 Tax=Chitinimonas sp. PSY-7 TaxID=3459088 RepID=UPI00403FDB48
MMTPLHVLDVAVIGAGIAGLSCANALTQAGLNVAIFDKARSAGGRMATRRGEFASFDHGAQYFTAHLPTFHEVVAQWQAAGVVTEWKGRIVAWDGTKFEDADGKTRYVAEPGMSGLCRYLLGELNFFAQHKLIGFDREGDGWRLDFENGETAACRRLVLALPAPQSAALLENMPELQATIAGVIMSPAWAVMTRFSEPINLDFAGCFVNQGPLSWVARDSSKPGRPAGEAWVLHGSPSWSQAHVNEKEGNVSNALLAAFRNLAGIQIGVEELSAHRWLYAQADNPMNVGCLMDASGTLGLAGDWINGSRVEGAWDSGFQLAEKMLST